MPEVWTDQTIIAGDDDGSPGEPGVFALTPADGGLRVDPLPNPGSEPGYTWGYQGTGPTTFYEALVRCALRRWAFELDDNRVSLVAQYYRDPGGTRRWPSPLWKAIATTKGPIRLPWPQVVAWARADFPNA